MLSEHSSLTSPPDPFHLPSSCLLSLTRDGDPDPGSHSLKTQGHSRNSGASPSATTRGCSAHGVEPGLKPGAGTGSSLEAWIPLGPWAPTQRHSRRSTTLDGLPCAIPVLPQCPAEFLVRVSQTVMFPQSQSPHDLPFPQSSSFRPYAFRTAGERSFLNSNFPATSKCRASECFQDSLPSRTPWPPAGRGFPAPLPRAKESKWTNKSKRWIFRMHPITPNNQDAYVVFAIYNWHLPRALPATAQQAICHLPLWVLAAPLQLLTFSTPRGSSGCSEALCAPGSLVGQVFRSLDIFRNWFHDSNPSVQSLGHVQLCGPMDCSMPGLPVHHQLPEPTQTHVHWVNNAMQPSHPLSSPSSPTFNLSQHQGLFQWVSS